MRLEQACLSPLVMESESFLRGLIKFTTKSKRVASSSSASGMAVAGPIRVFNRAYFSDFSTAMKASCGISTLPIDFIRFLPSFCFSRSLRLRVMSPP